MKNKKNVIFIVVIVMTLAIGLLYAINAIAIDTNRNITPHANSNNNDNTTTGLTGNLIVFILPRAEDKFQKASELYKALVDAIGQEFLHDSPNPLRASKAGLYDNNGNIVKPSSAVKFYIDSQVKKKDSSTLTIEDISDHMLFGNNITIGGVLLKNGEVVGAVIIVTDQAYENLLVQNIEKIKSVIANFESKLEPWEGPVCLEYVENIGCVKELRP